MSLAERRGTEVWDAEEISRARAARIEAVAQWLIPVFVVAASLGLWQWFVIANEIPHYILPSPARVWTQLVTDRALLGAALLVTLRITVMALLVAVVGGVLLSILFNQSRFAELVFYPYAVILQVTPIVSVAPLIFIYVQDATARVLICAWIVAFFPILSNTTLGLKSTDMNLWICLRFMAQAVGSDWLTCNCRRRCRIFWGGCGLQEGWR